MADTDVFGLLSILLAAGGAGYLVRAWLLTRGSAKPAPSVAPVPVAQLKAAAAAPAPSSPEKHPSSSGRLEVSPRSSGRVEIAARSSVKTSGSLDALALPSATLDERPDAPAQAVAAPIIEPPPTSASRPKSEPEPEPLSEPPSTKLSARAHAPEIPRLEAEEDEDVEPTKVGKVPKRREIQPPVEKHVFDEGADTDEPARPKPLQLVYALAQTDPGRRRKQNEDSYLVLEDEGVFVVADGMGGHKGGQVASKLAVQSLTDAFQSKKFEGTPHPGLPSTASELARAIQMANATILEEATARPQLKGMGTTMCAVRFSPNKERLYIGHVGDSRCYRVRGGVMKQITNDHTMADYGVSGPEGAHLSRALGVWPTVPIDVIFVTPQLGDVYLICSDGLTKMIPDGTIATQLLHEDSPKAAIDRLVFFANAHGGKDNITVILLRVVEPGWKPPGEG
jgi:protein phosphatase